jgi:hypothetical protein
MERSKMRGQNWYVALLIGIMCVIRFGLSAIGYIDPPWLMGQLGISTDTNLQMPYIIRVWAIRDIVLAVLVATANKNTVRTLLWACVVIDITDIVSAQFSSAAGLFSISETWSLQLTAIIALIPELIAISLLNPHQPQTQLPTQEKQV